MTRCTHNDPAHGAITSTQGSNAGSLTMEYVNIEDSKINLIKTDLQMITISDVTATTPNINDQYSWGDQGIPLHPDDLTTFQEVIPVLYDTTGISLGLTHGQASEVVITNFNAPNYHQAYICAAAKVSLNNVDLGNGFDTNNFHNHRLNIDLTVVHKLAHRVQWELTQCSLTLQRLVSLCTEPSLALLTK